MDEFKRDFGYPLELEGVSFGYSKVYKYRAKHKLIDKFKSCLENWLDDHNLDCYFFLSSYIDLEVYDELSEGVLQDFEREFDVKCREYSISCNSGKIKYRFA